MNALLIVFGLLSFAWAIVATCALLDLRRRYRRAIGEHQTETVIALGAAAAAVLVWLKTKRTPNE